jgi:1-pyrroline-5-carboxylate dehydrogenase
MSIDGFFKVPPPVNEPVLSYAPGSAERTELKAALEDYRNRMIDIPMVIDGKEVRTEDKKVIHPPHELTRTLGYFSKGKVEHVDMAIEAALNAKQSWADMPWQERAAIFLKAADLIAGPYRARMNAATMLAQSKNVFQAEIDCVCELVDFYRFNVHYMTEIYKEQPESAPSMWNRLDHRPLEGFVFALTPFNFTSIAGNLPTAPAMLGNTVVWKVATTQVYSAGLIMHILQEAGLPDGVINLIFVDGPVAGESIFNHTDFAGIHFTGSTGVFQTIWKTIGNNIANYRTYPRIVGETGGKDFVVAHESANPKAVATALARGAFEFQGQKCSAASRAYISRSIWKDVKTHLVNDVNSMKMGPPEDFTNFINAVIDASAYQKITSYVEQASKSEDVEIIAGGNYDNTDGYFIEPTVLVTTDPQYVTMQEEIFGPVLTIYVFEDADFEATLELVDKTSPYALTGAVFAKDRAILTMATDKLRHSAGNFYLNDKPTGAVVGQQPFGGGRASGTNDKAGSILNLLRWVSPRTIKETFVTPEDYKYPFLGEE